MMNSEQRIIRLYDGPAPGSESWTHQKQETFNEQGQEQVVFNVVDPTLTLFSPDPNQANGTALIICPGGGFHFLSDGEGSAVARWLTAKGVTCFVLNYRLVECKTSDPSGEWGAKSWPEFLTAVKSVIDLAIADGQTALEYVRREAEMYNINPSRIGIIGFSAGGALTAHIACNYRPANRPDFVALIYSGHTFISRVPVPADAPPLFLLAATDDELGLASHSVDFYNDWIAAQKSAELHLYSAGGHGFGMKTQNLPSDRWIERFADWLEVQGLLDK